MNSSVVRAASPWRQWLLRVSRHTPFAASGGCCVDLKHPFARYVENKRDTRSLSVSNNNKRPPQATEKGNTATDLHTSLFKNPIVQRLWFDRQKAKQERQRRADDDHDSNTSAPSASRVETSYPFSSDALLLETYKNPWGQIRLGRMLEDLDALAGNIAFFHVQRQCKTGDDGFPVIVTASVDRIRLRRRPPVGCDQLLAGHVTWTGRSSMEIKMSCSEVHDEGCNSNNIEENADEWLEAYVTFVTLDPKTNRPIAIPPVVPVTPQEKQDFHDGEQRAKLKKQLRQQQKQHDGTVATTGGSDVEGLAKSLLQQASPLLNLPSLANPHDILMDQTALQNALIAQPQVQNLHNRVFGGFLMRRAFELAFATVYCFAGARPIFLEVDQVSFTLPVDVGDLLVFRSHVLYTDKGKVRDFYEGHSDDASATPWFLEEAEELPLVHVEVEAQVTVPEEAKSQVSNRFNFTFAIVPAEKDKDSHHTKPREDGDHTPIKTMVVRRVLPGNMEQARRMATRIVADREQRKLDKQTR